MIELALITALSIDGIIVLVAVLAFAAAHIGTLQGTVNLKIVPPGKRKPQAVEPPQEVT